MNREDLVYDFLSCHGIRFSCIRHKPLHSVEDGIELAAQIGIIPCKSLLVTNRQHKYFMVLVQGDEAVDLHKVAEASGSSRLSFASLEAMDELLYAEPGSVSPLGLIFDTGKLIRLIIDSRVLMSENIILAPCVNYESAIISSRDFIDIFLPAANHSDYVVI